MTASSSTNNDTAKLIITALAASGISAALTYYLSSRNTKKKGGGGPSSSSSYPYNNLNRTSEPHRPSMIFQVNEDVNMDAAVDVLMPHSHEERMRRRIATRISVEEENSVPRSSVTVRVPASSANCGPGYDCIGLAVDLWTEVTVTRADEFGITAEGEGAEDMPRDGTNLLVTGVRAAYDTAGKTMPPLSYHVVSRIPYARGLGSSSAAIVAGIIAGLVLAGHRLPVWGSESLLQIAATIEGHPDNVAPVSSTV